MIRTFLIAIAATLVAISAAAQEAATPPRFFIERIEVRNADRVSPEVVVSESRLREGAEYSEVELSDAAARLNRLPYLLSAEFSLEKGSERGRHVLVITLTETKPFFYLLDFRPIFSGIRNDDPISIAAGDPLGGSDNQGVLGARWFVGRRGAIHLGLFGRDDNHEFTEDYSAFMVGYTQYDLFGTQAFATLNLKRPLSFDGTGSISPQLVVGVPLSLNQTLTLTYDETRFSPDTTTIADLQFNTQNNERIISARWSYNTTNDPFLPTSGTLLSATPLVAWRDSARYTYLNDGPPFTPVATSHHLNSVGLDLAAARYFELSERNSIAVGGEAGWARVDERSNRRPDRTFDSTYEFAHATFSHSLWDREEQKRGDSRFDWELRVTNRDNGRNRYRDGTHLEAAWAWVRRSSFGIIRLGLGYAW
ncbi:MAG: hypothetical protein M3Q69_08280 [Acidobacteriota bacterium]|nr:hypothetical protein [Acidobacteriota bacterium]